LLAEKSRVEVVTEEAFPLQYQHKDKVAGAATELLVDILNAADVNYSIQIQPWARAYNISLHKPNVLIYSIARTTLREPLFYWIGKVVELNAYFYSVNDLNITAENFADAIQKYRLAVVRESLIHHYLKSKNISGYYLVDKYSKAVKLLINNRVDLASGSDFYFYQSCKKAQLNCSNVKQAYQLKDIGGDLYFAMSKASDPQLVERISAAYQKISKTHKSLKVRSAELYKQQPKS